jgi:hypothetical protein
MTKIRKLYNDLEEQIDKSKSVLDKCKDPLFNKACLNPYYGSKFRNQVFKFQDPPTINNAVSVAKKGSSIRFRDLCRLVRDYIVANELCLENGSIKCDSYLKDVVVSEIDSETSFFKIAAGFRRILV